MTRSSSAPAHPADDRETTPEGPPSPWDVHLPTATLVLFGLAAVAVTQPLLDLLGRNAEFFVAADLDRDQIVTFALVVAGVPGGLALAAVALARLVDRRAGAAVYASAVAGFGALFALVVLRHLGIGRPLVAVPLATAVAVAVAWAERRVAAARSFLRYLAVANLVFLGAFMFTSRSAELLGSPPAAAAGGEVAVPDLAGPVVVVVLDELPLTTLLREDGTINEERFPNFARLAATSTWFRNASSLQSKTHLAVPEILTGRRADPNALPTYRDHPRNLLTLLGGAYPVERYTVVSDLCPPTVCEPGRRGSLRTAVEDAAMVYGHLTLPDGLRDLLPDIGHSWGNFGDDLGDAAPATADPEDVAFEKWNQLGSERSAGGQSRVLLDRMAAVTDDPALHLVHVALPHPPWTLNPRGLLPTDLPSLGDVTVDDLPGYVRLGYQLHVAQVGATDRILGEVLDDLDRRGVWDDALVAVVSDHGTSLSLPDWGRDVTDANRDEVLRVSMFVKAPGQRHGETSDDPALTIDLLPSIVDLLDVRTDWRFDGHSLFDGSEPRVEPRVSTDLGAARDVLRRRAADFPHARDDWTGVAAAGPDGDLVGAEIAGLREGAPSDLRWSVLREAELAHLPTPDGRVPYVLAGWVAGSGTEEPPEIVIGLNGRVAGTVTWYGAEEAEGWRFDTYLADFFVDGANEVAAFEVERSGDGVVLHRLPLDGRPDG